MLTPSAKDNSGFTLVELLIVVAIIGVLAAIAIPQFAKFQKRGYIATLNSDIRNAYTAAQSYLNDYPADLGISAEDLLIGGYTPSEGVTVTTETMTLSAGEIALTGDFPLNNPVASVTFEGVVTPADDD